MSFDKRVLSLGLSVVLAAAVVTVGMTGTKIGLKNDGEQEIAQIRLASERMGKALLSALEKACPNAKIGYERPPEQTTAVRQR